MAVSGTPIESVHVLRMGHEEETDVIECKDQWDQEDPPE